MDLVHHFSISKRIHLSSTFYYLVPLSFRFANIYTYVFVHGIAGALISASMAYQFGTISTMEKHLKMSNQMTGILLMADDIGTILSAVTLTYYASRGHKPRWIAVGLLFMAGYCALFSLPYFICGAPEALQFTEEHGSVPNVKNTSDPFVIREKRKLLCNANETLAAHCDAGNFDWGTTAILVCGRLMAGVGLSLCGSLGVIYLDDNIGKTKSPLAISKLSLQIPTNLVIKLYFQVYPQLYTS